MSGTPKVVNTSANCYTAGLLIPLLKENGYHTVGLIRKSAHTDAHETLTDWMNSNIARKALEDADFIIHLSGEINAKTFKDK